MKKKKKLGRKKKAKYFGRNGSISILESYSKSILVTMGGSGSQLITQRTTPIVPPEPDILYLSS